MASKAVEATTKPLGRQRTVRQARGDRRSQLAPDQAGPLLEEIKLSTRREVELGRVEIR